MISYKSWIIISGISVGLSFGASAVGQDSEDTSATRGGQTSLVLQGLTRPSKQVELALRVSGIIDARPIEEGQQVKAGQLIATLESGPEEAAVSISQIRAADDSEIIAAQVNEIQRQEELDRQRDLTAKGSSSVWELRVVELACEFAKAQTVTAQIRREQRKRELIRDQARLELRRLYVPFDGVIWRTTKDVGEVVDGVYERGTIAVLLQLDPLWVELNLPAQYFGRIAIEQEAMVTVQQQERTATVISVDPMVDSGSSTFRVRLELTNKDGAFIAGLPASVRFELSNSHAKIVKRGESKAMTVSHRISAQAGSMDR